MYHAPSYGHGYARRHARSATGGSSGDTPSPLTFEEWAVLVPGAMVTPEMMPYILPYRAVIEAALPQFTSIVMRNPQKLADKGFNIPARFLVKQEPSREEIIQFGRALFRKVFGDS